MIGRGISAAVVLLALGAGAYFAQALPRTGFETDVPSVGPLYGLLRKVCGDGRVFPVACLAAAVCATAILGKRASGDRSVGAFLALGWILFPPVLAIMSLATPIAPAAALIAIALAALWPGPRLMRGQDALGAFALAFAALLGPAACWAALATAIMLLLLRPRLWTVLAPALGVGLAMTAIAAGASGFAREPGWIPPGRDPLVFGAVLPFGMIWAGSALAAIASRAHATKYRLGLRTVWICRAAPLIFAGLVALAGRNSPTPGSALLSAGTALFPLALIGILPLIVWVRFAMPKIRSMGAWLAFPVIMYCCFWATLGPIARDGFPLGLIPDLSAPFAGTP